MSDLKDLSNGCVQQRSPRSKFHTHITKVPICRATTIPRPRRGKRGSVEETIHSKFNTVRFFSNDEVVYCFTSGDSIFLVGFDAASYNGSKNIVLIQRSIIDDVNHFLCKMSISVGAIATCFSLIALIFQCREK